MAGRNTDGADIARRLDGQTMVVPDLGRMMSHWPSGRNEHAPDIEQLIEEVLERTASDTDKANVMEADPALLASCFWPNASKDQLVTMAMMVLWEGRLDDYIESLEFQNAETAREFRNKVKEYILQYLHLSDGPRDAPETNVISGFQPVAKVICRHYNEDQRRALKVSLFDYIDSTSSETRYVQNGQLPTNRYYDELRKRTGGVGPLCTLAEFASGTNLSSLVTGSIPYKLLLEAVTVIVGYTNDLLSLKKELRKRRTVSAVPVLLWNDTHRGLQSVVDYVVGEIEKAVKNFDIYETRLIRQNQAEAEQIQEVTATLKTICTGNLAWSLASKRYDVGGPEADGSFRIQLTA